MLDCLAKKVNDYNLKQSIMKKLIFGGLFLATVSLSMTSCEKEIVTQSNSTENETINNVTKEAPTRGVIACSIKDANGNEIAAGTRCGTPTGSCGRYSNCKAVSRTMLGELPEGMSYEEFVEIWNDDTKRETLISLGYYEVDIK